MGEQPKPPYSVDQLLSYALSFEVGNAVVFRYTTREDTWWVSREPGSQFLSTDGEWVPADQMNLDNPWTLRRFKFTDVYSAINAAEEER